MRKTGLCALHVESTALRLLAALATVGAGIGAAPSNAAAQPYFGEVISVGANFCPSGWLPLDGRLLSIGDNDVLFSLIGTRYGGDGQINFALPNAKTDQTLTQGSPTVQCISLFGVYPVPN